MARARIGKLFHLTPLVDDLGDAEYFFNSVFSPLCMMRNYSEHWHRHAAIYIIAETSIEPMHCLGPRAGSGSDELVPLRGAVRPAGPQHGVLRRRPRRPRPAARGRGRARHRCRTRATPCSATRRTRRACSSSIRDRGLWRGRRPRFRPEWNAFVDVVLGAAPSARRAPGLAHHRRRRRSPRRREVLRRRARRGQPLPDQDADRPWRHRSLRGRGRRHRRRDARPGRHRLRRTPATSPASGRRSPG